MLPQLAEVDSVQKIQPVEVYPDLPENPDTPEDEKSWLEFQEWKQNNKFSYPDYYECKYSELHSNDSGLYFYYWYQQFYGDSKEATRIREGLPKYLANAEDLCEQVYEEECLLPNDSRYLTTGEVPLMLRLEYLDPSSENSVCGIRDEQIKEYIMWLMPLLFFLEKKAEIAKLQAIDEYLDETSAPDPKKRLTYEDYLEAGPIQMDIETQDKLRILASKVILGYGKTCYLHTFVQFGKKLEDAAFAIYDPKLYFAVNQLGLVTAFGEQIYIGYPNYLRKLLLLRRDEMTESIAQALKNKLGVMDCSDIDGTEEIEKPRKKGLNLVSGKTSQIIDTINITNLFEPQYAGITFRLKSVLEAWFRLRKKFEENKSFDADDTFGTRIIFSTSTSRAQVEELLRYISGTLGLSNERITTKSNPNSKGFSGQISKHTTNNRILLDAIPPDTGNLLNSVKELTKTLEMQLVFGGIALKSASATSLMRRILEGKIPIQIEFEGFHGLGKTSTISRLRASDLFMPLAPFDTLLQISETLNIPFFYLITNCVVDFYEGENIHPIIGELNGKILSGLKDTSLFPGFERNARIRVSERIHLDKEQNSDVYSETNLVTDMKRMAFFLQSYVKQVLHTSTVRETDRFLQEYLRGVFEYGNFVISKLNSDSPDLANKENKGLLKRRFYNPTILAVIILLEALNIRGSQDLSRKILNSSTKDNEYEILRYLYSTIYGIMQNSAFPNSSDIKFASIIPNRIDKLGQNLDSLTTAFLQSLSKNPQSIFALNTIVNTNLRALNKKK